MWLAAVPLDPKIVALPAASSGAIAANFFTSASVDPPNITPKVSRTIFKVCAITSGGCSDHCEECARLASASACADGGTVIASNNGVDISVSLPSMHGLIQ